MSVERIICIYLIPTLMFRQFSAVMYMQVLPSINLSKLCNYTIDR
jgi:hypothetical protein